MHGLGKHTQHDPAGDIFNAFSTSYTSMIPWYVIHSCCHHEARVQERFQKKGLEVFLPRHSVLSRRRDRKKLLQVPLFPGYLFVHDRLAPPVHYDILNVPGVVRVLANGSLLLPVPQDTIASIKLALATGRACLPNPALPKGKRVRVVEGPLAGVIGVVQGAKTRKRKIIIEVELFHQGLAVELDDDAVEPWS